MLKNKPKLTILIGISASGKSTYAKNELKLFEDKPMSTTLFDRPLRVVSSDSIRKELGSIEDQSNNAEVFRIFNKRIKENLLKGNNVIAYATSITIKARRSIIENVKNIDCTIVGHVFTKPLNRCIEDNKLREHPVPDYVIEKQVRRYQIPFYEEGFDKIIINHDSELIDIDFLKK